MLEDPIMSILGKDPNRKHRINANSFQQHAITTIKGWQYAALYTDEIKEKKTDGCYLNLARRQVLLSEASDTTGAWETFLFEDYKQTVDDGHNTISIGVCRGDGTIHVAFDHHCDQ
jgi:ABC-type phosphate transport system substrate-binding protein